VQPVEEVGTEAPRPHRFLEIAIRRGDHPHVYPKRPARPYRFELLLLQNTKKLHLRLEGQLADLVEEDRAAIGELEAADAALQGTGEGTLHMSEQLALDQTRGDGAAVHLHQRTVAAGAAVVDRAGDPLFAGPGLAKDEHAGIARRYLVDFAQRGAQGRARTDELLEWMLAANLFLQIDVLTRRRDEPLTCFLGPAAGCPRRWQLLYLNRGRLRIPCCQHVRPELVASDGKLDPEAIRRQDVSQALCQCCEKFVSVQVARHRPVDFEERRLLVPQPAEFLVGRAVVNGHRDRGR